MESLMVDVYLYDKTGTSRLESQEQDTKTTISGVIGHWNHYHQNDQISAISDSIGGIALDPDLQLGTLTGGEAGEVTLYDVTPEPEPETITGFFLDGQEYTLGGSGGGEWGSITGTLSNQTDLQTALNGKQDTLVSGTNIKTINNTSLLGSGNIDIQSGGNYTAGNGIDITNDEIGLDGTYEGTFVDYSAIQGPAPSGFHVPLNTEWQAVYDVWTSLGGGNSDGTNFAIALKLPFAGNRNYIRANVRDVGSYGNYWSSTPIDANSAYLLYFFSLYVSPQRSSFRSFGFSVRCFKDSPVIPTSSWAKLYGTSIEAGGIFWSSTDGLISLSSDGNTWITIQDKNLGATQVWSSGDTLSEANCGKYYQRGNNYGFPFAGSVTTSMAQVNSSTYGPGNYYSSSTFITGSSDWSSVQNDNLWGGVTGILQDSGNLVLGDKLYKIVTSTTAPASGTASNIITIVTD